MQGFRQNMRHEGQAGVPLRRWTAAAVAMVALVLPPPHAERVASAPPGTARPMAPTLHEVSNGRRLRLESECGVCHRIDGVPPATGRSAPSLVGWPERPGEGRPARGGQPS